MVAAAAAATVAVVAAAVATIAAVVVVVAVVAAAAVESEVAVEEPLNSLICRLISTVLSQVLWQECLTEPLESVNPSQHPALTANRRYWRVGPC